MLIGRTRPNFVYDLEMNPKSAWITSHFNLFGVDLDHQSLQSVGNTWVGLDHQPPHLTRSQLGSPATPPFAESAHGSPATPIVLNSGLAWITNYSTRVRLGTPTFPLYELLYKV